MFVGHYGISFAVKSRDRTIPLGLLFLAVQLLDVVWAPLVLLGIEKVRIVPGITASSPLDLYFMPYTHSLVAALLWSAAAFVLYNFLAGSSGKRGAFLVALAVFSHWVLDWLVHRPDLPLYDNTAKVGLGLWNFPIVAFGLEAVFLFGGIWLYLRNTGAPVRSAVIFGLVMLGVHAFVFFGPPPPSSTVAALMALGAYAGFAFVAARLNSHRRDRSGSPTIS